MAVLGGYVWGMQYIFRRYTTNDLIPAVYQTLTVRMVLAAAVRLDRWNAGYRLDLGALLEQTGDLDRADSVYRAAERDLPYDWGVKLAYGAPVFASLRLSIKD